jgi:hypothetical protein
MVMGLLCDEAGPPVSSEVFPGKPPAPRTGASPLDTLQGRCGVTAITCVGDRGMLKGQQGADWAQHGLHSMTAMTKPQMEQLLRTGTWHLDLFEQEWAEGLTDEGSCDGLRRHPLRAQAMRATRHAKLATLQAQVAKQHHDLTDHPRAHAQGALQQRVARAETLRMADWVKLTVAERALTLTLKEEAQTEAAQLDGCSGLQTALTPAQAPKELVHDRDKALASVAHAFRACKTVPLAVRPLFLRRAARTRAHACVVLLASQSMRSLASCWSAFDVTVAERLHALTTLGLVAVAPQNAPSSHGLPTPHDAIARFLHSADLTLPKAFPLSGVRVSTRKKLPSERMPQCIQLLH